MAYINNKKLAKVTTLSYNKEFGGINIRFGERLPDDLKAELSDRNGKLAFSWHKRDHYWYAQYSEEKLALTKEWLKKNFGMDVTRPDKKTAEALLKVSAEKEADKQKKASEKAKTEPKRKSVGKTVSQDGALQQMLATMDERMDAQDKRIETLMNALSKNMEVTEKLVSALKPAK